MTGHRRKPAARDVLKGLAREPLVQFLVIGAVLLGGYWWLDGGGDTQRPPTEIRLTVDDLAQLLIVFESKWNRPPDQHEFNRMVEDRIREDILYREALALGLDKEDTIVKRRMAQKMQFLAEDMGAAREPTEEELRAWFEENQGLFSVPARLSFRHVYFSPDQRGPEAASDAERALQDIAGLPQDSPVALASGDRFMFQDFYGDRTPQAIANEFGPEFAQAIGRLAPGSWQGPVESGYGQHLVFVDTVVPGRVPAFEEVAAEVETAWLGTQKAKAWEDAYAEMRGRYTVLLPVPQDDAVAAVDEDADPAEAGSGDGGAPL